MSSRKSARPRIVTLQVIIRYNGLKATQYFSKFTQESEKVLRKDLVILKMAQPKHENIRILSFGTIEFWWPGVPENSQLHRSLQMCIRPDVPLYQTTLKQLSIAGMHLQGITQIPTPSRKRSNPSLASISTAQPANEPHNTTNNSAEDFLSSIQLAPRPAKIPKLEPVEPTLSSCNPISSCPPPSQYQRPRKNKTSPTYGMNEGTTSNNPEPDEIPIAISNEQKVQRLSQALLDARSRISTCIEEERKIISELRLLQPSLMPEKTAFGNITKANEELAAVKQKLEAAEVNLTREKELREEAQNALKDVERECKAPFVVPALLDAFLSLSSLTSQTMQSMD